MNYSASLLIGMFSISKKRIIRNSKYYYKYEWNIIIRYCLNSGKPRLIEISKIYSPNYDVWWSWARKYIRWARRWLCTIMVVLGKVYAKFNREFDFWRLRGYIRSESMSMWPQPFPPTEWTGCDDLWEVIRTAIRYNDHVIPIYVSTYLLRYSLYIIVLLYSQFLLCSGVAKNEN